jgi:hypothetical protein
MEKVELELTLREAEMVLNAMRGFAASARSDEPHTAHTREFSELNSYIWNEVQDVKVRLLKA